MGAQFQRQVVDGVPAYVGDQIGPVTGGVVFRVGSADETLLEHGFGPLVAELAAVDVEGMHWIVHETSTIFFTTGSAPDVKSSLQAVCAALRALADDDIIDLADTILNERSTPPQPPVTLLGVRFGARTFGLGGFPRLGLLRANGARVRAWVGRHYTRANCILWSTGPLGKPRLGLPAGAITPLPTPVPTSITLPAWCPQDWLGGMWRPFVYFSAVTPGSYEALVTDRVVEAEIRRRAHQSGLVLADREANVNPWTASFDYTDFRIDVGPRVDDGVDVLLGTIDDLADVGPDSAGLAQAVDEYERWISERAAAPGIAAMLAWHELMTGRPRSLDEVMGEIRSVSAEAVAKIVNGMRDSAIVVVPKGAELIDPRFAWLEPALVPPVKGTAYRPRESAHDGSSESADTIGADDGGEDVRLIVGADGVTYDDGEEQLTVRFADCAAAVRFPDDTMVLYAGDGTMISVAAGEWIQGMAALAKVTSGVPSDRIVDAGGGGNGLAPVEVVGAED
jgi:zinc protease